MTCNYQMVVYWTPQTKKAKTTRSARKLHQMFNYWTKANPMRLNLHWTLFNFVWLFDNQMYSKLNVWFCSIAKHNQTAICGMQKDGATSCILGRSIYLSQKYSVCMGIWGEIIFSHFSCMIFKYGTKQIGCSEACFQVHKLKEITRINPL